VDVLSSAERSPSASDIADGVVEEL